MARTDKTLLSLVKCAIHGYCDETLFDNAIDWNSVFSLANQQAIPVLVADGLQVYLSAHPEAKHFTNESVANKQKRMQWVGQLVTYERLYDKHEKVVAKLAQVFAKKGFRMMVLKGYGLSLDWPVPNHRLVGDLDIYNFEKWKEADELVSNECGVKVDDEHEHHTVYFFEGVAVENHYDFINKKAHHDAPKIEAHLKSLAEKDYKEVDIHGSKIYLPSADFNTLFLMRHMGQHFAGSHLNLRQVLDWGFFVRAHHSEVDWEEAIDFLKEIGLYVFFNQINAICVDYLGFAEDLFPIIQRDKGLEKRILGDIFHPEFAEEKPSLGLQNILAFKLRRWWHNRWKHKLIYNDKLWVTFVTLVLIHLKRIKTIKD